MKSNIINILGWYGLVAILVAYFLNSFNYISNESLIYQILNLTGALGIVLVSYSKRNYQPMYLNIVWMIIAFVALIKMF